MDFRIVIDTREQEGWAFDCPTVRRKLDAGDYSVDDMESAVAVERKSLKDFVSTVIHDFARFAAELQKLSKLDAACVVVEANLDQVLRGLACGACGNVAPASLLGAAVHISLCYGVPHDLRVGLNRWRGRGGGAVGRSEEGFAGCGGWVYLPSDRLPCGSHRHLS